jgi:hypothetical protein
MPLALAYIMFIATAIWLIDHVLGITSTRPAQLVLFGLNLLVGFLIFGVLDSGVFVRGSVRSPQSLEPRRSRAQVAG